MSAFCIFMPLDSPRTESSPEVAALAEVLVRGLFVVVVIVLTGSGFVVFHSARAFRAMSKAIGLDKRD